MKHKNQKQEQIRAAKQVTKPTRYSKHFTVSTGIKAGTPAPQCHDCS